MRLLPSFIRPSLLACALLLAACDSPTKSEPEPPAPLPSMLATGGQHTCRLDPAGALACWGSNDYGQLALLGGGYHPRPQATAEPFRFQRVTAGEAHTCALASGGTAYCWGFNQAGQTATSTPSFGSPRPAPILANLSFVTLDAGSRHTCGVTFTGDAYCWGDNVAGQLGNGESGTISAEPKLVTGGHRWTELSAGYAHTCGVTTEGDVYCWGLGLEGQLGDGGNGRLPNPVRVDVGGRAARVSAGGRHSCALRQNGATYCWGDYAGQVGWGSVTQPASRTPVPMEGAPAFVALSAGPRHTCALTAQGAAWCWGDNSRGELGTGGAPAWTVAPQPVAGGMVFNEIDASAWNTVPNSFPYGHTCALAQDGGTWCWGMGQAGQLGTGGTAHGAVPVRVNG